MRVLSAVKGSNKDLLPMALALYTPPGSLILDATWGKGTFWRRLPQYLPNVVSSDLFVSAMIRQDFRNLAHANNSFDAVVFDPPYLYMGGFKTLKHSLDKLYNNKDRALKTGIYGVGPVHQMFEDGMREAYRVLRPGGALYVKSQDQIMGGRQVWQHIEVMNIAGRVGFKECQDMFVLVQTSLPIMRHKNQLHARRNHSYLQVYLK